MKNIILIILLLIILIPLNLFADNVETFLADNNINPLVQDSTTTQSINKLDYNASYAIGSRDATLIVQKAPVLLLGFGCGLLLSLPGALIGSIAVPHSEPGIIPPNVDSEAYINGYHANSRSIKKKSTLIGGVWGSFAQVYVFVAIISEQMRHEKWQIGI